MALQLTGTMQQRGSYIHFFKKKQNIINIGDPCNEQTPLLISRKKKHPCLLVSLLFPQVN